MAIHGRRPGLLDGDRNGSLPEQPHRCGLRRYLWRNGLGQPNARIQSADPGGLAELALSCYTLALWHSRFFHVLTRCRTMVCDKKRECQVHFSVGTLAFFGTLARLPTPASCRVLAIVAPKNSIKLRMFSFHFHGLFEKTLAGHGEEFHFVHRAILV